LREKLISIRLSTWVFTFQVAFLRSTNSGLELPLPYQIHLCKIHSSLREIKFDPILTEALTNICRLSGHVQPVGSIYANHPLDITCIVDNKLWSRLTEENRLAHVFYDRVYLEIIGERAPSNNLTQALLSFAASHPFEVSGQYNPNTH
jgi:hypothetical protein